MEDIQKYLLTIISVAVLSSILLKLLGDKTAAYRTVKMMCGILMVLTIVSPLLNVSIQEYVGYFDTVRHDSVAAVEEGENLVHHHLRRSIKEKTEAYILDKATLLGADIHVSVTCDTSDIPIPISVELSGNASPYARSRLRQILQSDIGIPEDRQKWT